MIKLQTITEENFDDVIGLSVKSNQEHFMKSNVYSLAQCYLYREANDVFPFAILKDELVVGFVLLYSDEEDTEPSMTIWRMMIGKDYQQRGYGKKAMHEIIQWVQSFQKYNLLYITHHPENLGAHKLYESLGFKEIGMNDHHEILMQFEL